MVSSGGLLISFVVVLVVGAIAVNRYRKRLPDWCWVVLGVVPPMATWACCVLGAEVTHALIKVRLSDETRRLVYAGASLLAILPALFWGRLRSVVSGVWLTALGILMLGDVWYYRFFGALPSVLAFGSGGQIWEVRDSAAEVLSRNDWLLIAPILLGLALAFSWPCRKVLPHAHQAIASLALAGSFALASKPIVLNVRDWMGTRFSWKVFSAGALVRSQGLWGAHFRETARSARELLLAEDLTPERIGEVTRYHQTLQRRHSPHFGFAAGSNLLLVQVEALQQWAVAAKTGKEAVMPFLAELLSRSVYYSNVWDLTGESPTSDCEYMVLNSQHPLQRGAVAFRRADNEFVTLGTELSAAGYSTFSSHGYHRTMWNRSILHPRYGFAQSAFVEELRMDPKMGWGLADVQFFERASARLNDLKEPWFGFFVTLTSHHPYTYIPRRLRKLELSGMDASSEGYVHSMRYVDDALKVLFAQLERDRHLDNTLVVIYGDHDAKLNFNQRSRAALTRQLGIPAKTAELLSKRSFETKKIPFVIIPPKAVAPEVVSAIGGQVDIGPTVLDWLGIETPNSFVGRVLFNETSGAVGCAGCEITVRYDGSAVSPDLLWDAPASTCNDRTTGLKTDHNRCAPLRAAADTELAMSWDLTLHDLAKSVRNAPADVQAARSPR